MNPRVASVKPLSGHRLELTFVNGEVKHFDMAPYLATGIFSELQDERMFRTVKAVLGSIAWENGADLCPDTLYLDSGA
jgi:Protein of unknown function (DUF2442)